MTDKIYTIDEIKAIVKPIAEKYKIEKVWLFGSYARGEASSESDVDLHVDASNIKSLFVLGGLYSDLEKALDKQLDLITTQALIQNQNDPLSKKMQIAIRKDGKLLYEEVIKN